MQGWHASYIRRNHKGSSWNNKHWLNLPIFTRDETSLEAAGRMVRHLQVKRRSLSFISEDVDWKVMSRNTYQPPLQNFTCLSKGSGQLVPKTTRTQDNSYPGQLVPRATRTKDNSYPGRLVPRTIRTQDDSYPGQLVPKTTITKDDSYPGQLVPRTTRTQDDSYPVQLVPRTTRTQDDSFPAQVVPRTTLPKLYPGQLVSRTSRNHSQIITILSKTFPLLGS